MCTIRDFLPLLWQFLLIPNRINVCGSQNVMHYLLLGSVLPKCDPYLVTDVILPSIPNIVKIYKQIIILIFYYASCRLVTLLKLIYASVSPWYFCIVSFRYSLFWFLKVLLASCLTCSHYLHLFDLHFVITAVQPASLSYKHFEHSSSNCGLFCFNSQ
jgi:hypothetical protein